MSKPRKPRPRHRYSIGEWYGVGFHILTPTQRFQNAKREQRLNALSGDPCPFAPGLTCNKKGGVCSLLLYEQTPPGPTSGSGTPVTTCPRRFLQDQLIFQWIGDTILGTKTPLVLDQIGFLDRLRPGSSPTKEGDGRDFIGKIDNVLVHPTRRDPVDWCAVELQAVYFSGKAMSNEFAMLAAQEFPSIPFPAKQRRPDWRSSGPKRLLPQLQTKVPTIARWGKKTAVVIDEAFFGSLVGLRSVGHISNAEIVWFVVGFDPSPTGWRLARRKVVFTDLDASVEALTGGVPLPRPDFEKQIIAALAKKVPAHPLTRPA